MADPALIKQFNKCLRYRQAKSWQKPFLNPARFVANQLRFRPGSASEQAGQTGLVAAFHLPQFRIVQGEIVSSGIAAYGIYEPELTEAFLRLIEPGWTVVDIGMHLGYYTTLFACLVGPKGVVHAFEPTPSTRELASFNVDQFKNVHVHPLAVWSSAQKLTFHDYGLQFMAFNSFSAARIANVSTSVSGQAFTVDTLSLDSFRESAKQKLSLIKIDAESAEEEILKGAEKLLRTDRPLVSLEVGDYEGEPTSRRLIELFRTAGYTPWEFAGRRFREHSLREHYEYDNLIFCPAGTDLSQK